MQQLDYWFDKYPEGFYKFLSPSPNNKDYREGDSWEEELGFSAEEFQTAFRRIGVQYKSKTAYEAQKDKFGGSFYCSFFDRREGLTWYLRNDKAVDKLLTALVSGNRDPKPKRRREAKKVDNADLPETGKVGLQENRVQETGNDGFSKPGKSVSRNRESRFTFIYREYFRDYSRDYSSPLPPSGGRANLLWWEKL